MRRLTGLVLGGLLTTVAACGGAPAKSATPTGGASELEGLTEDIEAAARTLGELDAPVASAPGAAGPPPQAEPVTESKKSEPGKPDQPAEGGDAGQSQPAPPRPSSSCETACKALGSMKRSQERICEIAGASHEKCTWAKQKVADASSRVERAGCECS